MEEQPQPPKELPEGAFKLYLLERGYNIIVLLLRYGFFLGLAYIGYLSLKELAGKATIADIAFTFLGKQAVSNWGYNLALFVSIIWALTERKLRLRKTKYLSERPKNLEKQIDPNRTSSGLQPTGETNPEDKP
ncbi:hypothetical protein [Methylohalobius crimeensis]|uniref:hypothetical protein n=1 Tax=Methylohalobius crimeensis TaxID=244365 RepID=UPI0003B78915|nr:hypothetical protein [Methylohalobius crimeensis]